MKNINLRSKWKNVLLILVMSASSMISQTPIINLDGVDDYVDLGIDSGDEVRTIEFWFRLAEDITPQNENFVSLITRYSTPQNVDNFSIAFQPNFLQNPGCIRFNVTKIVGAEYSVYSNSNSWEANVWHHLAAVIHPQFGMNLFIDGIKQSSTNTEFVEATAANNYITTIGSWGRRLDLDRYFKGGIDDVRFSTEALYTEDFVPNCPNIEALPSTTGLWNFNGDYDNWAIDSSQERNDAYINGPVKTNTFICTLSDIKVTLENDILVFPNPAKDILQISEIVDDSKLLIYNYLGHLVFSKKLNKYTDQINVSEIMSGHYIWKIQGNHQHFSGKLIIID